MIPVLEAVPVVVMITLAGIAFMLDLYRNRSCEHCPHCKSAAAKKAKQKEDSAHERYHFFAGGAADACGQADCPGLRKRW